MGGRPSSESQQRSRGAIFCEEKIGEIRYDGVRLYCEPAEKLLLRRILEQPLWLREGALYAKQDAEQFVRRLHEHLHGSYFWAGRAAKN